MSVPAAALAALAAGLSAATYSRLCRDRWSLETVGLGVLAAGAALAILVG